MESRQTTVGAVLSRGCGVRDHKPGRDKEITPTSSSTQRMYVVGVICVEEEHRKYPHQKYLDSKKISIIFIAITCFDLRIFTISFIIFLIGNGYPDRLLGVRTYQPANTQGWNVGRGGGEH